MSPDKPKDQNNDHFEFLFGKPSLLEGEDHGRYMRLREAIVADLKPETVFDWINVHDQVNKIWEEQRYRRAAISLINGGMLKAVEFYLEDICEPPFHEEHALNFFSGNPKERQEVISDLKKHGIGMAELQAKAAQLESGGLQLFDRLAAARENSRRMLLKEAQRSGRRRGGGPDDTAEQ